ncbi:MAG: hypothetical protein NZ828_11210 [Alphaproteobacteria bacterium]|nr:hypothetical protein [Alphaproteobacteria bacterium]
MKKEPNKALVRAVIEYKSFLERMSLRNLSLIDKHISPAASFKDPFFIQGSLDQRKQLLRTLCGSAERLKVTVSDVLYSNTNDYKVYIKWHIRLHDDMASLEGMSEITFDHNNMIIAQDDFWDSASTIWAAHPLMRWLFSKGKKKIFG